MKRRAIIVCCVGAALVALAVAHAIDVQARNEALRLFLAQEDKGIARIVARYGPASASCAASARDDLQSLAFAFVTTESFATPYLEASARGALARAATAVGLPIDITLGPGRIRPSTALRVSSAVDGEAIATRLLRACDALEVVTALLATQAQGHAIDLAFVRKAAAAYNGQSAETTAIEARLSAEIYFRLVYAAFQHDRFSRLAAR